MAADPSVRHSEEQQETPRSFLFRLGVRVGAIVFFAVLVVAMYNGLEPGLALMRASAALLAITACGWVAEKAARVAPAPTEAEAPQPDANRNADGM